MGESSVLVSMYVLCMRWAVRLDRWGVSELLTQVCMWRATYVQLCHLIQLLVTVSWRP